MQAYELVELLQQHRMATHVNLIPWNPVDDSDFQRPPRQRVLQFQTILEDAGITATKRVTRGLDAAAACGQLRNVYQKNALPDFEQLA